MLDRLPVLPGWVPYDASALTAADSDWSCGLCSEKATWRFEAARWLCVRCDEHVLHVGDDDGLLDEYIPIPGLGTPPRPIRPAVTPNVGRLLLLASAVRTTAIEAQDAAAAGKSNAAMQRANAIQKLADTMTGILNGEEEQT